MKRLIREGQEASGSLLPTVAEILADHNYQLAVGVENSPSSVVNICYDRDEALCRSEEELAIILGQLAHRK